MRTFIIRARKGTTRWDAIRSNIGTQNHFEVIAHTIINAFFTSNDFRVDVDICIVLEKSDDFPRTLRLVGNEGLTIAGFHEEAVFNLIERALKESKDLKKDETKSLGCGIYMSGFGFEKCVKSFLSSRPVYFLDRKGSDIREIDVGLNPVFILSDHLPMPKNSIKGLLRHGVNKVSLGKKMLFASQCVVLIHHELDRALL